jgi:hypothetical protein
MSKNQNSFGLEIYHFYQPFRLLISLLTKEYSGVKVNYFSLDWCRPGGSDVGE